MKLLLITLVYSLTIAAHARVKPWQEAMSLCAQYLEGPYHEFVEENGNEILFLHALDIREPGGSHPLLGLSLGKRLGAGWFGQVMLLNWISDAAIENGIRWLNGTYFNGPLIVKIPHAARFIHFGMALPYTHAESVREWKSYQLLREALPEIEKHAKFPKNPPWKKGVLPTAPILGALRTERGLLLFKPALKGLGLKEIAKLYRENGRKIPDNIIEGLRNQYQFAQAVYGTVKIRNWHGKIEGFSLDLRPPNLLWFTESPDAFGYAHPGTISYEMAMTTGNEPMYIEGKGFSEDEFIAEFERYLAEVPSQ